ncbi:MAG TPA: glycosyltransferase [Alphaproteobacteria bacterium]|nr:glycosyltransferase [Alphaproteobacteria bacterium]
MLLFFCPSVTVINGGIRNIFRMAESLRAAGHDARMFEAEGRRPGWFPSTIPIEGQDIFQPRADQVLVLPEDQPHILAQFKDWPQKKAIYTQNHFYGALGIGDAQSYADYGVSHLICASRTILEHAQNRHPSIPCHLVPCGIDRALFKPAAFKANRIAFMPRKRAIEAVYIRDMFRFTHSEYRDWQWQELSGKSEAEVAQALGEAKVFLSLSRLEGFGLAPLEAMAAGCVVAGFTGIGGREYATEGNGFWAAEDDFPACVDGLAKAVALADMPHDAYDKACDATLAVYAPGIFKQAVAEAWTKILA